MPRVEGIPHGEMAKRQALPGVKLHWECDECGAPDVLDYDCPDYLYYQQMNEPTEMELHCMACGYEGQRVTYIVRVALEIV